MDCWGCAWCAQSSIADGPRDTQRRQTVDRCSSVDYRNAIRGLEDSDWIINGLRKHRPRWNRWLRTYDAKQLDSASIVLRLMGPLMMELPASFFNSVSVVKPLRDKRANPTTAAATNSSGDPMISRCI